MARRLETRAEGDAPARHQRDPVLTQEPGGCLGRVAGVGVVRKQADEAAAEPQVERREQQRQRRLGNPGRRPRHDVCERAETLALGKLAREDVEHRQVHDERRNAGVPPPQSTALPPLRRLAITAFCGDPVGHPGPPPTFERNEKTVTCLQRDREKTVPIRPRIS